MFSIFTSKTEPNALQLHKGNVFAKPPFTKPPFVNSRQIMSWCLLWAAVVLHTSAARCFALGPLACGRSAQADAVLRTVRWRDSEMKGQLDEEIVRWRDCKKEDKLQCNIVRWRTVAASIEMLKRQLDERMVRWLCKYDQTANEDPRKYEFESKRILNVEGGLS